LEAVGQHHLGGRRLGIRETTLDEVDVAFEVAQHVDEGAPGLAHDLGAVRRHLDGHAGQRLLFLLEADEGKIEARGPLFRDQLRGDPAHPLLADRIDRVAPRAVDAVVQAQPVDLDERDSLTRLIEAPVEAEPQPEVGHRVGVDR
jgi:hypothetical protein